jgi:hypothetical protein
MQVQSELSVDMSSLSDVAKRVVSNLNSNSDLSNIGLNVFQRMLLISNNSDAAKAAWTFLEKMLIKVSTR